MTNPNGIYMIKTSTPGMLQVRRTIDSKGMAAADMIYNELETLPAEPKIVDPMDPTRRRSVRGDKFVDLLQPVIRAGEGLGNLPALETILQHAADQQRMFHPSSMRLDNPHSYPVGLESQLFDLKSSLVLAARKSGELAE